MTKYLVVKPGWNPIIDSIERRDVINKKRYYVEELSVPKRKPGRSY